MGDHAPAAAVVVGLNTLDDALERGLAPAAAAAAAAVAVNQGHVNSFVYFHRVVAAKHRGEYTCTCRARVIPTVAVERSYGNKDFGGAEPSSKCRARIDLTILALHLEGGYAPPKSSFPCPLHSRTVVTRVCISVRFSSRVFNCDAG